MLGGMVTTQHVVATTRFHHCTLIKSQHNTFPLYKVQNCSIEVITICGILRLP
jgi:hypothetical protein